jgi:hypothetical protein
MVEIEPLLIKQPKKIQVMTKNILNGIQIFFKWWPNFFNCWIIGGNQFTSIRQLKLYRWWLKNYKHRLKILFKRWPIFFKCLTWWSKNQMIKKNWSPKLVQKKRHHQKQNVNVWLEEWNWHIWMDVNWQPTQNGHITL